MRRYVFVTFGHIVGEASFDNYSNWCGLAQLYKFKTPPFLAERVEVEDLLAYVPSGQKHNRSVPCGNCDGWPHRCAPEGETYCEFYRD